MRMVAETYGVEKDCESLLGSIYYLLRLIKYRAPREDESNVGLFPHADQTFMSILHQAQVNGLEIMTKNGDWMLIDSLSPSSFIVMAGDVCMVCHIPFLHSFYNFFFSSFKPVRSKI